ncbi:hypothetical protein Syun_002385 [Stephania yunnanensis]|uniref:START domain-containing protein n=1 Tax=Stephania yunnanensis TaxID=152371 RepID=A0AAP0Q7D6_9MAGN
MMREMGLLWRVDKGVFGELILRGLSWVCDELWIRVRFCGYECKRRNGTVGLSLDSIVLFSLFIDSFVEIYEPIRSDAHVAWLAIENGLNLEAKTKGCNMERKQKKLEYRERLDKTLSTQALVDKDFVTDLVRKQLLSSSSPDSHDCIENFIEKRSGEVANFLDMLRSASANANESLPTTHAKPQRDWKLKQDNEDYRVMYREGPQGSPFHTLLVEGFVDGPIDVCLSLAWEAALYGKWWPQFSIPPFKIVMSKCVQKVRIGEEICLVRVKVPWPVSSREVVANYFVLEYFEDDLLVVLLNSISDIESIDKATNGFTNDGIPEAKDVVRMDLMGGFALQKVTSSRSYFRTMATIDMKIDFVPPSLINFVSRQLIGSGFKLYQKTVASIAKGDEDFNKALGDPLYVRIREGLYQENKRKKPPEEEEEEEEATESKKLTVIRQQELPAETVQVDSPVMHHASFSESSDTGASESGAQVLSQLFQSKIKEEEEETESKTHLNEITREEGTLSTSLSTEKCEVIGDKKISISPQVERALNILDNAISVVRGGGLTPQALPHFFPSKNELQGLEKVAAEEGSPSEYASEVTDHVNTPSVNGMHRVSDETEKGSCSPCIRGRIKDSPLREMNHSQVASESPNRTGDDMNKSISKTWSYSQNRIAAEPPTLNNTNKNFKVEAIEVNEIHESVISDGAKHTKRKKNKKKKSLRFCFFPCHA